MLSLTHKHQRHTSHNTAGRAPQCGIERRAPESRLHTFSWPMSLCGGSAEQDKETGVSWFSSVCVCVFEEERVRMYHQNWISSVWTYRAGVSEVLVCYIRARGADLPGVPKQLGCGLHYALSCCEVVLCVTVKVAAQAPDAAPQVCCQTHIHTHTWKQSRMTTLQLICLLTSI